MALLVLGSAFLHASWNLATRRVQGNLAVLWLSLALAGAASLPLAVAECWRRGVPAALPPFVLATSLVHAAYFSLLVKA